MFVSSKLQDSRLYFRVIFEVIQKFAPALNSLENLVTQILRRVPIVPPEPYRRGRARESVPIFAPLLRHILQARAT